MKFWKSFLLGALFFGMTSSIALAAGKYDQSSHAKITHVPRMNFGTHLADQTDSDTEQAYKISDHDQGKITPDDTSIVIESDSEQGFEVDVVFSKPKAPDGTEINNATIILHGVRTHTTNGKGTSASDQLDSDNVKTDLIFVPGEQQELVNADYGEGQGVTIIDFDSVEIVLDPPDKDQTYTTKMEIMVTDRALSEDSTMPQTDGASEDQTPPAITDGTITQEVNTTSIAKEKLFDASWATAFDNSEIPLTVTIDDEDYNNINWDQVGDYPVKFIATDGNDNSSTGTITVKIVDTIAPVLTVPNKSIGWEVKTTLPTAELLKKSGVTATDNSGITPTIMIDPDDYNEILANKDTLGYSKDVQLIATDSSGNVSETGIITVTIVDTIAPVITNGSISQVTVESPISISDIFSDSKATATDNSGVAPTITIDQASYNTVLWTTVTGDKPYSIKFTATDSSGNSTTGTIDVTINYEQILIEWLSAEEQIDFSYNYSIKADSISWQQGTVSNGIFEADANYQPSDVYHGTILDSQNNAVLMTFKNLSSLSAAFSEILSGNVRISTYTATPNLADTSDMFFGTPLTSLDLSSFDTSAVQNMNYMFRGAAWLESITFGKDFNTSKVTDMSYMFDYTSSLKSLDLSRFDTSSVQNMDSMFERTSSLESITFGKSFNTSRVTDMSYMFFGASILKSLDLSSFDTSAVQDMKYMFYDVSSVKSLDLSSFSDQKLNSFSGIFDGMTGMNNNGIKLDLNKWSTDNWQILNSKYSDKLNWINNSESNLYQADLALDFPIIKK